MPNRKEAEKLILEFVKSVDPSGYNLEQYTKILSKLTDKEFHNYMEGLRNKTMFLVLFKPPFKANDITVENNLEVAKKYEVPMFERLVYNNQPPEPSFQTPIEYLVLNMPYRRQSQTIFKKASVPDHNKVIDELTYQPTGESKGARISYPELQVLIGMGLENTISELIRFRGGDKGGFNAYNAMFLRYGNANLATLDNYSTGTESTKTLKSFLTSMHISNTI